MIPVARKVVAADLGLDPGRERPPANHPPHVGLEQGIASHLPDRPRVVRKSGAFPVLGDAGSPDVLLQIAIKIMVDRHLVLLAALLAFSWSRTQTADQTRTTLSWEILLENHQQIDACALGCEISTVRRASLTRFSVPLHLRPLPQRKSTVTGIKEPPICF
ncbi:MAG: hypothetical protein JWQ49_4677 [Edaphobacter sp.]|nr:hypothetical protein [Edaphobacter sp.]